MENQFKKVLQLKEKEVDLARIELEKANKELTSQREALNALEMRSQEVDIPTEGNVGMIHYTRILKDSFRHELLSLRHNISFFESEVNKRRADLNLIQMEYEKFQHLYSQEVDKRLKLLKEKESKELDEIGNQLYYAKRNFY